MYDVCMTSWSRSIQASKQKFWIQAAEKYHGYFESMPKTGCWTKNRGCFPPKMDGENNGKPYEQMDDLGVIYPIFGSTPNYWREWDVELECANYFWPEVHLFFACSTARYCNPLSLPWCEEYPFSVCKLSWTHLCHKVFSVKTTNNAKTRRYD